MEWPTLDYESFVNKKLSEKGAKVCRTDYPWYVLQNTADGSGVDAAYFHVSDTVGVKFFNSKSKAERMWRLQDSAFRNGFGPEPGPLTGEVEFRGDSFYGFLTERVTTIFKKEEWEKHRNAWTAPKEMREMLAQKLRDAGLAQSIDSARDMDLHDGNIGHAADGRPVILDFSFCEEPKDECESVPV